MTDVRLIERWLPIEALGEESTRERRSMTALPPIYYLHVWWARRPLVASRAAVLASLLPADADRDRFLHVIGIHGDPVATRRRIDAARRKGERFEGEAYSYPRAFSHVPDDEARRWLTEALDRQLVKVVVLDPTAGGGSIPFEASRLGLETLANDINPVATLIMRATAQWPCDHGHDLKQEFQRLADRFVEIREEILASWFPAEPNKKAIPTNYLWARTVTCPYCDGLVPLSPNWRLASGSAGVRLTPHLGGGPGSEGRTCTFDIVDSAAEQSPGTVARGDGTCPFSDCTRVIDGDVIKEQAQAGKMGEQLYAVVYKERVEVRTKTGRLREKWVRGYRAPRPEDDNGAEVRARLEEKLPEWEAFDIVPSERIPDGNKTTEPQRYGMNQWRDLFSPRQLLCHGASVEVFREMLDADRAAGRLDEARKAAYGYLALSLDKLLNYNSRMSVWMPTREVVANTFNRHDFAFCWSHAELAPLVTGLGYDWAIGQTAKCIKELVALVRPDARTGEGDLFAGISHTGRTGYTDQTDGINRAGHAAGAKHAEHTDPIDHAARASRPDSTGRANPIDHPDPTRRNDSMGHADRTSRRDSANHPARPSRPGPIDPGDDQATSPDPPPITITCKPGDSLDHIGDASIDVVVMDPPYYDNVMYAELSDFFYVWLKRTAGRVFPELFRRQLTDKENEAVANPARFRGEKGARALAGQEYRERMAAIFAECRRVLKPDGIMTLMFTHKATGAWDALTKGLIESGFAITASWPVNTEAEGSLHIKDKAAANSTIFLVCRPRAVEPRTFLVRDEPNLYWEDVEPKVAQAVRRRVGEFQDAGITGVDLYLASFGPALEEFSRHWPLKRGTPRELPAERRGRRQQVLFEEEWDPYAATPEDALGVARREVKRWRLEKLTHLKANADLDPATAFFVLAWDAFRAPAFSYDEALRLARAVGVDLDAEVVGRLAEKKGSDVRLWDSARRAAKGALGPADGSRCMIDAVHHAANLARLRSLDAAREMLAAVRVDRDPRFFASLEAVLEVLPVSRAFTGTDLAGAAAASGADFEILYHLSRLAYGDRIDEPEQLKLWRDEDG